MVIKYDDNTVLTYKMMGKHSKVFSDAAETAHHMILMEHITNCRARVLTKKPGCYVIRWRIPSH